MPGVVVANQPGVFLVDEDGNVITAADGTTISDHEGILIAGKDGSTIRFMRVAADGTLRIDPTGTTTQPVSAASLPLPAGAATEATLATLATETKLEAVRALLASLDGKDFATQTTLALADGRLTTIDAVLDSIKDIDGIKKITDELPAGTNVLGRTRVRSSTKGTSTEADVTSRAVDANIEALHVDATHSTQPVKLASADGTKIATLTDDAGVIRQEVTGKVSVIGAVPPPSTTGAIIYANSPLSVGRHTTTFSIPDGETFHLQEVTAGNENPTKGAVVEVLYDNGSEHLVARVYTNGETISIGYPDLVAAQDGTALLGAAGTSNILVRRQKFSGSNIAIDATVTGYY
jgi:hypothetical protein